jgi:hypothetical protein
MPLKVILINGEGDGTKTGVTSKNSLKVTNVDPIALELSPEELTRRKQLRDFLVDSSNSKDLNVDGSVTPQIFSIAGETDKIKWISEIRIVLKGANLEVKGQDFKRFGLATAANTPLTNGLKFYVEQGGVTTNFFIDPIKTIGEFMNYADEEPSNFINAVGSQEDALYFKFLFKDVPITLPQGTVDRIVMEVRDDLTAIDEFRVIASGSQEVSEE